MYHVIHNETMYLLQRKIDIETQPCNVTRYFVEAAISNLNINVNIMNNTNNTNTSQSLNPTMDIAIDSFLQPQGFFIYNERMRKTKTIL